MLRKFIKKNNNNNKGLQNSKFKIIVNEHQTFDVGFNNVHIVNSHETANGE